MNGYLRDLDQQVREKKEREARQAQEDLARERSMVRRNGDDWHGGMFVKRGGGGEPLRDADGKLAAGVRGLFTNNPHDADRAGPVTPVVHRAPGSAAGQGSGQGGYARPGSTSSRRNSRPSVARRDPNQGHGIFVADDAGPERRRGNGGDVLVAPSSAHEVGAPHQQQPAAWPGRPRSGGQLRRQPQPADGRRVGAGSSNLPPPQPHQPAEHQPPLRTGPRSAERSGAAPPRSSGDRIEVSAEWLERILLERDQLRRQLQEAGLAPCC